MCAANAVRPVRGLAPCQSDRVPYSRAPAWRYFPQSDAPPPQLEDVATAFENLHLWLKESFWQTDRLETTTITQHLEEYLKPDAPEIHDEDGLLAGWNVETREK